MTPADPALAAIDTALHDLPALPADVAARLDHALRQARAAIALAELAAEIDPDHSRSRWRIANDLAAKLDRFESAAWRRIRTGARPPRDRHEELLAEILAGDPPRSPRRLLAWF